MPDQPPSNRRRQAKNVAGMSGKVQRHAPAVAQARGTRRFKEDHHLSRREMLELDEAVRKFESAPHRAQPSKGVPRSFFGVTGKRAMFVPKERIVVQPGQVFHNAHQTGNHKVRILQVDAETGYVTVERLYVTAKNHQDTKIALDTLERQHRWKLVDQPKAKKAAKK